MKLTSSNKVEKGVVFKKTIGNYQVHANGRLFLCELSTKLRKELIYPIADPNSLRHRVRDVKVKDHADPIAVGDMVHFIATPDGRGLIVEVLPRKNKLTRRTAVPKPGGQPFEQVIVSNVDQMVPVFSIADPVPKWNLLDRCLASAESIDLPSLICITKKDLVQTKGVKLLRELHEILEEYRRIGYPVLLTSVVTGEGLLEVKQALQGQTSIFLGKSGVGKSSLLNALQPGLGLKTSQVSHATGKGRHTTSYLEMFPLEFGGGIVDTPGIREFGLWDIGTDDLVMLFPEFRPYAGTCKFRLDCSHDDEPGCAIRKAVTTGQISPRRYRSFLRLKEDLDY